MAYMNSLVRQHVPTRCKSSTSTLAHSSIRWNRHWGRFVLRLGYGSFLASSRRRWLGLLFAMCSFGLAALADVRVTRSHRHVFNVALALAHCLSVTVFNMVGLRSKVA